MKSNSSNDNSGDKSFDVEKIITRRIDGKKCLYLIKWEGYPITACTWEPISHLSNIIDMVKEFEDNFPQSINQKLLKEFYLEYQKYKYKKYLQKKRILKTYKNKKSNKIVIPLEDLDLDFPCLINEEEKKEEEISKNDSNSNSFYEMDKKKETENKNIDDNNDILDNDKFNEKTVAKLIKPIIIW